MNGQGSAELPEVRRLELPNAQLLEQVRRVIQEGHTATIQVKGYSMRPFLEHGRDKVVLARSGRTDVGDAVLAEVAAGVYVLHRIVAVSGDELTLMGDGNLRGTEHCRRSDVAGVVTHYVYPRRTVAASDRCLCRRIRLWRRLLPVRRVLLLVYKIGLKIENRLKK